VLQAKDELLEGARRAADFHAVDFGHERAREYTVPAAATVPPHQKRAHAPSWA
jgi:hypothetical protein